MNLPILKPSDFVALVNQTFDVAYPIVLVEGEVSNFKISKDKWVYFDLKDEVASLKCFATIYKLRLPVEDGMKIVLSARPQLHPQYNFSLQVIEIKPSGEGSIKKAVDLLKTKLENEGLFDESRKRSIPKPPEKIGLITSSESAAYGDFLKIIQNRWPLVEIFLKDTKVQGSQAADEIIWAIESFSQTNNVDVLVIIRGGGSADDLLVFQDEKLVRTIAGCRIPTLVAIGHERDVSLSELVADLRASTPSNAAELLAPSRFEFLDLQRQKISTVLRICNTYIGNNFEDLNYTKDKLNSSTTKILEAEKSKLDYLRTLLNALDPNAILKRGYSIVTKNGDYINQATSLSRDDQIKIRFTDGDIKARVIG